jgi:hypothetical protein
MTTGGSYHLSSSKTNGCKRKSRAESSIMPMGCMCFSNIEREALIFNRFLFAKLQMDSMKGKTIAKAV